MEQRQSTVGGGLRPFNVRPFIECTFQIPAFSSDKENGAFGVHTPVKRSFPKVQSLWQNTPKEDFGLVSPLFTTRLKSAYMFRSFSIENPSLRFI